MERQSQGWKLVFKPGMIVVGAMLGLGVTVLLQQYGVTTFTTGKLVLALFVGALVGVFLGSAGARRHRAPVNASAAAPATEAMK